MNTAKCIIDELWKLNRIFCSQDYCDSLDYLDQFIPLKFHIFTNPLPYKGWKIPPKWDLIKASIKKDGKEIYTVDHPLKIIGLSSSFDGSMNLEDLKKHLHFDSRDITSIPYHFRQHYRPWQRDWGFCVTKQFYDSLTHGNYEIEILTKEAPGFLQVAECVIEGHHPEGFLFAAHLDHPGMANDDLAGVAVGVEVFQRLLEQPKPKFTYRLLISQEIIGSVFFLGHQIESNKNILESCFLEMLGSNTPLALQHSYKANSFLENTIVSVLKKNKIDHYEGPFRSIICNDETVFESYGIPMASLSRYPYPEYHSDKDNISIIHETSLKQSVDTLLETIAELEKGILMKKEFEGVIALSNPEYNLYVDPGQQAFGGCGDESIQKWRQLMDLIPLCPKTCFVNQIAGEVKLPLDEVIAYLKKWEAKSLLKLL